MDIQYFNSKALSDGNVYDLTDPVERIKYFHAKLGDKIDQLKVYLDSQSFIAYMLAKKLAGKGTYAKMVEDVLGAQRVAHISIGDVIRKTHVTLEDNKESAELLSYMEKNYRGMVPLGEAFVSLVNRSQEKISIPTDFLLCLLKYEIEQMGKKALFIDGLPRSLDQITASLYFRDLINYRDDPDFFVFIDTPDELLNARMVNRRVCPLCQTSRNLLFTPSTFINYDKATDEFFFVCDNTSCPGYGNARYVIKAGDSEGINSIKGRLKDDEDLMAMASALQGIPKIYLGSTYPVNIAGEYLEDYEIQPALEHHLEDNKVVTTREKWILKDNTGTDSYTIYAAVYVANLLSQMHKLLIG